MSLLQSVQSANDVEESRDSLGGNFNTINSNMYPTKLKAIYLGQAKSGAISATILADVMVDTDTKEMHQYSETLYFTNKQGKSYYEKDGKKHYLPGFNIVNAICELTTGKGILEQSTEKRTFNIYNYEDKKEVPTEVETLVNTMGKELYLGIIFRKENKSKKNDAGEYVDINEPRNINVIDLVTDVEKFTANERRAKAAKPEFFEKWVEKWANVVDDRYKHNDDAPAEGAPANSGSSTKSLFG